MTFDDFEAKYRPVLLGFLVESYTMRHCEPSAVGLQLDRNSNKIASLLRQMHADASNGSGPLPVKVVAPQTASAEATCQPATVPLRVHNGTAGRAAK